jgi:hypothetical protein
LSTIVWFDTFNLFISDENLVSYLFGLDSFSLRFVITNY